MAATDTKVRGSSFGAYNLQSENIEFRKDVMAGFI
jgi:hypothetical protein